MLTSRWSEPYTSFSVTQTLLYTFMITATPRQPLKHQRALDFIDALTRAGHSPKQAFFFGPAVQIGLPWADNLANEWRLAASKHHLSLTLCSASYERFALTECATPWQIGGLGTLMEAGFTTERVIHIV